MSKAISRRDFLKVSGAVGAAGLLAAWFYRRFHCRFFRRSFCGRPVF